MFCSPLFICKFACFTSSEVWQTDPRFFLTTYLTTFGWNWISYPGLAKFGIALDLGSRDRGFKSRSPDQNPASFHHENWRGCFLLIYFFVYGITFLISESTYCCLRGTPTILLFILISIVYHCIAKFGATRCPSWHAKSYSRHQTVHYVLTTFLTIDRIRTPGNNGTESSGKHDPLE